MKLEYFNNYIRGYKKSLSQFHRYSLHQSYDKKLMNWPSGSQAFKLEPKFVEEYKSELLDGIGFPDKLRAYLLEVYVNGIYSVRCAFERRKLFILEHHFKGDLSTALENEIFISVSSYEDGLGWICSDISAFLKLNCQYEMTSIDKSGFNISNGYFKEFTIRSISDESNRMIRNKELFESYIHFYEKNNAKQVENDKSRIENEGDKITNFIGVLNDAVNSGQRERVLWISFRYAGKDNFKLLLEWINHQIINSKSVEKQDNLAQSQETVIHFLIEKGALTIFDIDQMIKTLRRRELSGYSDKPRKLLEFHLSDLRQVKKEDDHLKEEERGIHNLFNNLSSSERHNLESIWNLKPKVALDELLTKGYDIGLWNENYLITAQKNSLYGTGKTLLASIYVALRGNSIKQNLDYKEAGKYFCKFFSVEVKANTKEPYKSFQNANPKKVELFRKLFKLYS